MRLSEERLSLTLNAVSDGGWDLDLVTGHLELSDAWLDSLGYARTDLFPLLSVWDGLVHPQDLERVRETRDAHLAGKTPIYECEHRLLTRTGAYRYNLGRGKVVVRDAAGRPLRMVGTDTDITQRTEDELERTAVLRKVQQSQKLESLGVVVGGIAHDFNNLLVGILGSAEIARRILPEHSELATHLDRIEKAGTRASELTGQMLAYAGRGAFALTDVDLSALAEEMPQLVAASLSKKAVLNKDLDDTGAWVHADAAQLRQVVMNLLINASDALGEGPGTITLRTGRVGVCPGDLRDTVLGSAGRAGPYAYVEVQDTGEGMSPDVLETIFDPFFTTKASGRGLGLAAVIGIVRWHQGAIRVDSTPGQGTTFRVLLPAIEREAPQPTDERAAPSSPWRFSGTVLVVDDEPGVRQIMVTILEKCGIKVLQAEDGRAGLAAFTEHAEAIDLVVLDMNMPHMSGIEAAQGMRELRKDLPIIVSSGYAQPADLESIAGARFVAKPFVVATFLDAVRRGLGDA